MRQNTTFKILILTILLLMSVRNEAQTSQEKAKALGLKAVKLEDEGKFDDALKLLEEAKKLDPNNIDYPYEMGYSYYSQGKYKKTIKLFKEVIKMNHVSDLCFQLLGNAYDKTGDTTKAFESYDAGLKLFPKSGKLYLEKGNVYWSKELYDKSLPYYEKGIEVAPDFPSNYYRATRIYCVSSEKVWGMIYGEIFLNLEPNSDRTKEISQLLYNTYKRAITFKSDSSMSVSFSQFGTITLDDLKEAKLPFGTAAYEPIILMSIINEKSIDLNTLDHIRQRFADLYFKNDFSRKYPNVLFDYHQKILKANQMEAYNHWVLMRGDEDAFQKWAEENADKWDSFAKWFPENILDLDEAHRFYRAQY
ncbi:MAG: tetratricopeptide repeat protein [Bacteroidota bacterium]